MKNLVVRTLTGIAFVAVMVGGILYSPLTCGLLFMVITVLTTWEFTGLVNTRDDIQVPRLVATTASWVFFIALFAYAAGAIQSGLLFALWWLDIAYMLIAELYLQREDPLNNWAFALMSQLYIALPFSMLALLLFRQDLVATTEQSSRASAYLILFIFIFLWCSDTGAYCCGSLFGRHKLFPSVSPGKTWEGSIGGGLLTVAVSQLIAFYGPVTITSCGLTPLHWAGFALIVVVFGTLGDLVESLMKRRLGVKDSGHLLPGHGGMLDRFDSSLLAIPASVAYLFSLGLL